MPRSLGRPWVLLRLSRWRGWVEYQSYSGACFGPTCKRTPWMKMPNLTSEGVLENPWSMNWHHPKILFWDPKSGITPGKLSPKICVPKYYFGTPNLVPKYYFGWWFQIAKNSPKYIKASCCSIPKFQFSDVMVRVKPSSQTQGQDGVMIYIWYFGECIFHWNLKIPGSKISIWW